MILETRPKKALAIFLGQCQSMGLDVKSIYRVTKKTIAHLNGSSAMREQTQDEQVLQKRWYAALAKGEIAWDVYDSELYFAELWACWIVYSRSHLRAIRKAKSLPPHGIVRDVRPVEGIVDLGCGIGYTTIALRQLFPRAIVTGTNLDDTKQTAFAQKMGKLFKFDVVQELADIDHSVDLVIAFEYFEHILNPIEHVKDVIAKLNPRSLLVANAFGTKAIGHFDCYEVDGERVHGKLMSKLFNVTMRQLGFEKIKTGLWNNRPAYWKRIDS